MLCTTGALFNLQSSEASVRQTAARAIYEDYFQADRRVEDTSTLVASLVELLQRGPEYPAVLLQILTSVLLAKEHTSLYLMGAVMVASPDDLRLLRQLLPTYEAHHDRATRVAAAILHGRLDVFAPRSENPPSSETRLPTTRERVDPLVRALVKSTQCDSVAMVLQLRCALHWPYLARSAAPALTEDLLQALTRCTDPLGRVEIALLVVDLNPIMPPTSALGTLVDFLCEPSTALADVGILPPIFQSVAKRCLQTIWRSCPVGLEHCVPALAVAAGRNGLNLRSILESIFYLVFMGFKVPSDLSGDELSMHQRETLRFLLATNTVVEALTQQQPSIVEVFENVGLPAEISKLRHLIDSTHISGKQRVVTFEKLRTVLWARQPFGDGTAEALPEIISMLAGDNDADRDVALFELNRGISEYGEDSFTALLLPVLVELAGCTTVKGREHLLRLCADLAHPDRGDWQSPLDKQSVHHISALPRVEPRNLTQQSLSRNTEALSCLLYDNDWGVRCYAAWVLAHVRTTELVQQKLLGAMLQENHPLVLASIVLALTATGHTWDLENTQVLRQHSEAIVRYSSIVGLLHQKQIAFDSNTQEIVVEALQTLDVNPVGFPWGRCVHTGAASLVDLLPNEPRLSVKRVLGLTSSWLPLSSSKPPEQQTVKVAG